MVSFCLPPLPDEPDVQVVARWRDGIRWLDGFRYPLARLWTTEDEAKQTLAGIGEMLEVAGGGSAWWLALRA